MAEVKAVINEQHYLTEITTETNSLIADEPTTHGGRDAGFSPTELLAASLAACTSITLRMYADRKAFPLEKIEVYVSLYRDEVQNVTHITRKIELFGALEAAQRARLLEIANSCPVHKILTHEIAITTELI